MTKPIDKDTIIRSLRARNKLLQKRVDCLAEDVERLTIEALTKADKSQAEARRKSWGGNGRY